MTNFRLSIAIAGSLVSQFVAAQDVQYDYPIQPVPFTHVHFHDAFWAPKIEVNAKVSIPYTLQKCRETGRIDNFVLAKERIIIEKPLHCFTA